MRWLLPLLFWSLSLLANDDATLAKLFDDFGVKGTMVIESLDGKESFVYNEARAKMPLLPASTFKIPNTLIALEEGVVNEKSLIVWDKVKRSIPAWNQDQTLESAFKTSCVWCYQKFARHIGLEKYDSYLKKLHYGNEKTGNDVERFWLDGKLRISAYEQSAFLKKLYTNDLPFAQKHLDFLKKIMIDEQGANYTVRAKTGWAVPKDAEHHGWYVGYVESSKGVYFFATNLLTPSSDELPLRKSITLDALRYKKLLE
ncbi:class D beta-lactamase [Sulfurospirillum sp. MES]|uniref:class D beta-lactamase n=1 Tax=Sulfurospirillum sp. MES TaxID=1565314 RepID=UPI000543AF1D|nr:class D beta-lactamase [Sulfurospirillum sp. MES]KHG33492.1 MAG: beta-lactamase [Sulfurospirillum sp. MES]